MTQKSPVSSSHGVNFFRKSFIINRNLLLRKRYLFVRGQQRGSVGLDDEKIVGLYFARDELALSETEEKYGHLLKSIVTKALGSGADADECMSDIYLSLWSSIPPARPESLRAYACAIARNLSFKKLSYNLAKKRSADLSVSFDELEASLTNDAFAESIKKIEFREFFNRFLQSLRKESRVVFLKRYYFLDSIPEIAADLNITEGKVKSLLFRARKKFIHEIKKEEKA